MTGEEFAPIWASLLDAWPAAKVRRGSSGLYLRKLAVFTVDEVRAAVDQAVCTSDFFPSVAVLWQRCVAIRDAAPGWDQAWREAMAAVAAWQPGATDHHPWPYSHPLVRDAVRVIGAWELKTGDNISAVRAQFRDAYLEILNRRRGAYATGQCALPPPRSQPPPSRLNAAGRRPCEPPPPPDRDTDPGLPERPVGELINALADRLHLGIRADDGAQPGTRAGAEAPSNGPSAEGASTLPRERRVMAPRRAGKADARPSTPPTPTSR